MALVRKLLVVCDKCGSHVEAPEVSQDPFHASERDPAVSGWLEIDGDHHLCPACAAAYVKRRREMVRELNDLAGIRTYEVSI